MGTRFKTKKSLVHEGKPTEKALNQNYIYMLLKKNSVLNSRILRITRKDLNDSAN